MPALLAWLCITPYLSGIWDTYSVVALDTIWFYRFGCNRFCSGLPST